MKDTIINIDNFISKEGILAMELLERAGHQAYLVGGCVRDAIRGEMPHDFDITTSAYPEETMEVFREYQIIATGLKHGTVTVMIHGEPIEITTFRVDGKYKDGRHPEAVFFTRSIEEDLARRDFTMNAIAMDLRGNLIDPFGGRKDIAKGIIRAVGDATQRFTEDGLRIARALRFSSCLGYEIEEETARAARAMKSMLDSVSAERKRDELLKLLCGDSAEAVLVEYPEIICQIVPELAPMVGFEQHNKHHIYDVYTHTAKVVANMPAEPRKRLAALLHDVGKPACFFMGDDGQGHFYGHPEKGRQMAYDICENLRLDHDSRDFIVALVKYHDLVLAETEKAVRRALRKMGEEVFFAYLEIKHADNLGQNPEYGFRRSGFDRIEEIARKILAENQCFSRENLAIDGKILMEEGYSQGKRLGEILEYALTKVVDGELPNEKEALLYAIRGRFKCQK